MRTLTLIFSVVAINTFGQNSIHPYNKVETELEKMIVLTKKTDSIIGISEKSEYKDQFITTRLSEGSIELTDSLETEIGVGGFSTYTYTNENIEEIIKAEYHQTVHYNYDGKDSINANTERIEISIYYINKEAFFSIINEYHYDNENVISTNKYYVELNQKREDVYYSNKFQEKMREYILTLSKELLNEK